MISSRYPAAQFLLLLCLYLSGFALALTCSRRDLFLLSGATIVAGKSSNLANAAEDKSLISLDSAAAQLRNGETPFSHRLNYPHPGLRARASPVTTFDSDLETLVEALIETMETTASTTVQYGIDARIVVLQGVAAPNGSFFKTKTNAPVTVFCNPTILARSSEDKMVVWREYCLVVGSDIVWPEGEVPKSDALGSKLAQKTQQSLLEVDLLRDETIEIAAQDVTGKPIRMSLSGEASRAFQHELDHLNGILIVDHAGLEDLPPAVAFLEEPYHAMRQRKAFERSVYSGNGPLYY